MNPELAAWIRAVSTPEPSDPIALQKAIAPFSAALDELDGDDLDETLRQLAVMSFTRLKEAYPDHGATIAGWLVEYFQGLPHSYVTSDEDALEKIGWLEALHGAGQRAPTWDAMERQEAFGGDIEGKA
jgi:hypothetical protein